MKIYVHSNADSDMNQENRLIFEFEYVVEVEYEYAEPISASIRKSGDLHFITVKILNNQTGNYTKVEREIDADFYAFVSSIISTAHSCGYVDLDVNKSPYSDSLYFELCHDSDFVHSLVEFIFYLRVSDHTLPVRSKDRNLADAKARRYSAYESESKQYNWINKAYENVEYSDDDPTPFTIVDDYVEYEGNRYDSYNEIISDVRKKLEKLKKKYKPQPIPEPDTESDEDSE